MWHDQKFLCQTRKFLLSRQSLQQGIQCIGYPPVLELPS